MRSETLVAAARAVAQLQAPPPLQRAADELELPARHGARGGADDAHALHHLARLVLVRAEHGVQLLQHRLQVAGEHAVGVERADQPVHAQQGVDLALAEPQPRQLVAGRARAGPGGEAIEVVGAVVDDRRVHPVAQVLQVALERGARHLELLGERLEAHAAAVADQQLDLVEAFGAVHARRACLPCAAHSCTPGRGSPDQAHPVSLYGVDTGLMPGAVPG